MANQATSPALILTRTVTGTVSNQRSILGTININQAVTGTISIVKNNDNPPQNNDG